MISIECPIQPRLKVRFTDGTLDVRMLWAVAFGVGYAWLNERGLYCPRQNWGQWTVLSEHMWFVRIFAGVCCKGATNRSWAGKLGYYSHYAASSLTLRYDISWDLWPFVICRLICIIVKALNGFLVIQRLMTLKVYNVWKLHRPRIWGRFF